MAEQRARWDERHAAATDIGAPAEVLLQNAHLLPARGVALDLACGRGANALWLAEHTALELHAWDFSPAGVARLEAAARTRGLRIATEVRDVVARPPQPRAGRITWNVVFAGPVPVTRARTRSGEGVDR